MQLLVVPLAVLLCACDSSNLQQGLIMQRDACPELVD